MDWSELFGLSVSPWELIVRGSAMYLFLFLLFRVVIKRRMGAVGMADILILVIVADAAQNGMSGEYKSITKGFIAVVAEDPRAAAAADHRQRARTAPQPAHGIHDAVRPRNQPYMEPDGQVTVIKKAP